MRGDGDGAQTGFYAGGAQTVDEGGDGDALGADAHRVRRVLDVGAAGQDAVGPEGGGPDGEAAVGRVGSRLGGPRARPHRRQLWL